jgi:serine phosphatase RsbU (regulator of sigma subunit)/anti-sigma regulatory factor (Ser/Thr protein kinase)
MTSPYTSELTHTQPAPGTRLHGRRLIIARVIWTTLVVCTLGLFTGMIPAYFTRIQTICTGSSCAIVQPSREAVRVLQARGLTVESYAMFAVVLTLLVTLTCVAVALLIIRRKSDDWMVLLAALTLVMEGTAFVTYTLELSYSAWQIPAFILSTLSWSAIFLFFSLFPDGCFAPPWARWIVIGWIGLSAVGLVAAFSTFLSDVIWLCFCTGAVVAQIYRYRRVSGPIQRQQTKWMVYGTSVSTVAVIALYIPILFLPTFGPGSLYNLLSCNGFILAVLPFPLSIGFAVQRSRLWDIDNIINRTLVYGLLTVVLALVYFGSVLLLQYLFRALTGQDSPFAIVVSTLAIVALFHRLRNSIQTIIDTYFFRRHYDVSKVLAGFDVAMRSRLYVSDQGSLETLTDTVQQTVWETLQPQHLALWVYDLEASNETDVSAKQDQSSLLTVQTTRNNQIRRTASPPIPIGKHDPLHKYFLSTVRVVEIEKLQMSSPALENLKRAGVKLSIPLVSQGELVGLLSLGSRLSEQDYSSNDRQLLSRLAIRAAPAIRVAQLARKQEAQAHERERIEQELHVARMIQHAFLPKGLPALPGWQVAAYYQPARVVGGDFYDFISFEDGRLGIVIGDVTDKGIPAALLMTTTRSILRSVAQAEMSPGKVLEQTNNLLCPDMPPNMFVTCLYAILDPTSGTLYYANAGHDQPYQRRRDSVSELWATGMPLGLMPDMTYEEKETTLAYGDSILFYSDGLVEAHNPEHTMYGFPRLMSQLEEQREDPDLIEWLLHQLAVFTGPGWEQEDDITLVTLQRSLGYGHSEIAMRSPTRAEDTMENDACHLLTEGTVPGAPGNERLAIDQVLEAVAPLNLPAKRLAELQTAVAEATMNAMEHGNQYQLDKPVAIQVFTSKSALVVRITDQGGGRTIPEPEMPDLEAKLTGLQTPRGWGLFLIKSLVDDLRVTSDEHHHTVELIVHLPEENRTSNP